MAATYESIFDFAFRCTYFAFLPPFVHHYWLGYVSCVFCFSWMIRALLMIIIEGKNDAGIYYLVLQTIQITANAVIYLLQKNGFRNYAESINKFLEKHEINPFDISGTTFLDIWNKNKPSRFVKWYFWLQMLMLSVWVITASYSLLMYVEKSSDTPWGFYSPLIDWGIYYKWLHVVFDTIMMYNVVIVALQADIALIAVLSFLQSQFIYLKLLLDGIFKNIERSDEMNKYWIEEHVKALDLLTYLNNLLKPHIMIKYVGQVIAVISISVTLSDVSAKINMKFQFFK